MKILMACGGTGGHIFPAVALAEKLRGRPGEIELLFALSGRPIEDAVFKDMDSRVIRLNIMPFPRRLSLGLAGALWRFFIAAVKSAYIIFSFRPDISIGFGGYASLPPLAVSALFGIPVIIHEQNVRLGLANRVLSSFARRIAVSFTETLNGYDRKKYLVTGNPLRKELALIDRKRALDYFGFSPDKLTLLVMGGSQGSHSVNTAVTGALSVLDEGAAKMLQVVHLSGEADEELVRSSYMNSGVAAWVKGFFSEMSYAYSAADIAVARSGATTIAELIRYGLPAVLMPYPYGNRHQRDNAELLAGKGAAILIDDDEASSEKLRNVLEDFIDAPGRLDGLSSSLGSLRKEDAAERLLDAVVSIKEGEG